MANINESPEEKARTRRHLRILYLTMAVMLLLPFILFYLTHVR
ncbi:MAG: hypothetical protein SFV32_11110 [Opitutaceae bacterium]|nr:hypothetical protein [Opitutaceae bacterium]